MTPAEHRDQAVQLLADVNDAADSTSAQHVLTQAAIAHALLGLLEIQIAKDEAPDMRGRQHRETREFGGFAQPICQRTGVTCYPICPDCDRQGDLDG